MDGVYFWLPCTATANIDDSKATYVSYRIVNFEYLYFILFYVNRLII